MKKSCLWTPLWGRIALGEIDVQRHQISVLLWASLITTSRHSVTCGSHIQSATTHIHSGKGKSREGVWLSCVSASLCPEILVSCWEVKSICLDSATWKYNCVGSLCYDTTCYLYIITAQVFSILEFDVHCWIGLFKRQGKLKEFVFGSWKDQELSCIMCELTPPTHSE